MSLVTHNVIIDSMSTYKCNVLFSVVVNSIRHEQNINPNLNVDISVRIYIYKYIYIYTLVVKLTFEMLTMRGHENSFSTHERMYFFFETENVSTWEGVEHPPFGSMPNYPTIWAITMRVAAYNVDSWYTVTNHNEGILHWSNGRELIYLWRLSTGSRNYLMCP